MDELNKEVIGDIIINASPKCAVCKGYVKREQMQQQDADSGFLYYLPVWVCPTCGAVFHRVSGEEQLKEIQPPPPPPLEVPKPVSRRALFDGFKKK